jgi:transposase InsO family protein
MSTPTSSSRQRWAQFRFAVIGPLLAAPPPPGELQRALTELTTRTWQHPIQGTPVQFGFSTLERWYHAAKADDRDPLGALRPCRRRDAGRSRQLSSALAEHIRQQYAEHRHWSVRLHYDNLAVVVREQPNLGPLPSYATVLRFFRAQGLEKRRRRPVQPSAGWEATEQRHATREVRSFELQHVNALWHLDAHAASRPVVTAQGQWLTPVLVGVLDDYSRMICHAQWYTREATETVVHALSQAIQKLGLPRALMSDRGGAEMAEEMREGLPRLGIVHQPTMSYSPHQNGKLETFWALLESRLMALLDGAEPLTLSRLNAITQAWLYSDYQRREHAELDATPLQRFRDGPDVARDSPDSLTLRQAFRQTVVRTQRRSDGTVSVAAQRFEIPSAWRTLRRVHLRLARWDLSSIDLIDPETEQIVATLSPLNKAANASAPRRAFDTPDPAPAAPTPAPLLEQWRAEYAATGLPPAYLPLEDTDE